MKRLVVAGATGRIGRILSRVWGVSPPAGLDVIYTGRRAEGPVAPEYVACRMTDPARFAGVLNGADIVLDLAGPTRAPGAALHAEHLLLFEAVTALAPCPVITMSTSSVYGRGTWRTELSPPAPEGDYGRAKLDVEARVKVQPGATALRLGNVAGADALLSMARPGRSVELHCFADGRTPRRSYLGPETLAHLLLQLCSLGIEGRLPKILNLCSPEPVEMAALLDTAGLPWVSVPAPDTAIEELSLSPDLLRNYVDMAPDAGQAATVVSEWRRVFP